MQKGAPELEELCHNGAGRGAGRGGAAGDARRQGAMALGGSAGGLRWQQSVDQMTELTAHRFLQQACAFLI